MDFTGFPATFLSQATRDRRGRMNKRRSFFNRHGNPQAHLGPTPVAQISNLPYRRLVVGKVLPAVVRSGLEIRDTARRGPAASKHSLFSIGWRRGPGRGGSFLSSSWAAPLLSPLPTPASWGGEEGKRTGRNRRGSRRFRQILIDFKPALRTSATR